jgi:hypothetical protein
VLVIFICKSSLLADCDRFAIATHTVELHFRQRRDWTCSGAKLVTKDFLLQIVLFIWIFQLMKLRRWVIVFLIRSVNEQIVIGNTSFIATQQRGEFGAERYERVDFQKKVREQFLLLKSEDEKHGTIPWFVLDARESIDDVHANVKLIVEKVIQDAAHKEIQKLFQ